MDRLPTQSRIVNAALARLGSTRRVSAIEDDADAEAVWSDLVRLLLASHPWNFAIVTRQLNPADAVAYTGSRWRLAFTMPRDCLRWLPPGNDAGRDHFTAAQEGDLLLTDASAPVIRYVSSAAAGEVSRWPPHFVEAVTLALAERLAEPVTQSASVARDMAEAADYALRRAKRADGLQSNGSGRTREAQVHSSWLAARGTRYVPGR